MRLKPALLEWVRRAGRPDVSSVGRAIMTTSPHVRGETACLGESQGSGELVMTVAVGRVCSSWVVLDVVSGMAEP
jgi:hypothetical protein